MKKLFSATGLFLFLCIGATAQTPMNQLTGLGNNMHLTDVNTKDYAGKILEVAQNDNVRLRLRFDSFEDYELLIDKN